MLKLVRAYLLACGVAVNTVVIVIAAMTLEYGPGAVRDHAARMVEESERRAKAIVARIADKRAQAWADELGLVAAPAATAPSAVAGAMVRGRRVLSVGPGRQFASPAAAASAAQAGDVIDIAPATYAGETVIWRADDLVIRARGGIAHMDGSGVPLVQDKAIWLIQGNNTRIENIAFHHARSSDRNGAGLRAEGRRLEVVGCVFNDNESGILTNNIADAALVVLRSTFSENGHADGQAHQIYAGAIARFVLRGSYLYRTRTGSAVKSRARDNLVEANRIVDGRDGRSNYTLDFSDGGRVVIVANELEQGPFSGSGRMIGYATEHSGSADGALFIVHNTLVSDRPYGTFVWNNGSSPARIYNNLLIGGRRAVAGDGVLAGNVFAPDAWFWRWGGTAPDGTGSARSNRDVTHAAVANRARLDYALATDSPAIDAGIGLDGDAEPAVRVAHEYRPWAAISARQVRAQPDAGAHEAPAR